MRDKTHIQSLERGLKMLEIIGQSSHGLTLTEVANLYGVNKTTTQRFLNTLDALGYISRDEHRRYYLTARIISLGFNYLNSFNFRNISKTYIDNLSATFNKTVNLAVLEGTDVLYLYRKEVSQFLKYELYAGSKLPAHCTSAGKILLAGLPDAELKRRLKKMVLKPITSKTITSRQDLWREIERIRKLGYSICDRELSMDLYSMAVPIINETGKIVAALNVTMDAREKRKSITENIFSKLIPTGELISNRIGYNGTYPKFQPNP